jgi:hypothetical protein
MSFVLYVRPRAIKDTITVHNYLEEQKEGLGDEFLRELALCYRFIEKHPRGSQIRRSLYRHRMVEGFRYRVVYAIVGRKVYVYQVRHTSQRPKKRFGP